MNIDKIDMHHNQDKVFKEALGLFLSKSPGFLEIDQEVTEILGTEITETKTKKAFADIAFKTSADEGIHLESEANVNKQDIMRFCSYNIDLARKHKIPFTTIIITPKAPIYNKYCEGSIAYTPKIIDLSKRDADQVLENFKRGEFVNELELVYLPLYSSRTRTKEELFDTVIKLADETENKEKILSLQILLMSTFIERTKLLKILEDNMLKLENNPAIEFFMEKGMEKGIEKGMEKGKIEAALEMFKDGLGIETIAKYIKMPVSHVEDILKQNAV